MIVMEVVESGVCTIFVCFAMVFTFTFIFYLFFFIHFYVVFTYLFPIGSPCPRKEQWWTLHQVCYYIQGNQRVKNLGKLYIIKNLFIINPYLVYFRVERSWYYWLYAFFLVDSTKLFFLLFLFLITLFSSPEFVQEFLIICFHSSKHLFAVLINNFHHFWVTLTLVVY